MRPVTLMLMLVAPQAHADWTTGQDIWPALFVDLTPAGFGAIEPIAQSVLPATFPIDVPSQGGQLLGTGLIDLDYFIGLQNFYVVPRITQADIVPRSPTLEYDDPHLDITLVMTVGLSDPTDPATVEINVNAGLLFGLIEFDAIDEDCDIYTNYGIPVTARTKVGLEIERDRFDKVVFDADGNISLDATFNDIELDIGLVDGALEISGCLVGDIAEFALEVGYGSVEAFLLAELQPTIDDAVEEAVVELEPQVEDLFSSLVINEQFDLLGSTLDVRMFPRDFFISDDGLRLELAGAFDPGLEPHPCIARYDTGLSAQSIPNIDPRYPFLGDGPTPGAHHLGLMVNDDWLNQAMYGVWYGGLLCQIISNETSAVDLPLALDTNLLGLMAAGDFDEFFEEPQDLLLATRPEKPPVMIASGPHTADIDIADLGLDFYAELDHRLVRAVGFNLNASAGVDADFDAAIGSLGVAIDFDPAAIEAAVVFNDLKPETNEQFEGGFNVIAQQLIGPVLGDALGDFGFDLPSFAGLGLTTGDIESAGPIDDFIGVYGTLGTVPYGETSEGCDLLGSDPNLAGGCGIGCSSSRAPTRVAWLLLPLWLACLRRRR